MNVLVLFNIVKACMINLCGRVGSPNKLIPEQNNQEKPFNYDLPQMEKALASERTCVPRMESYEDFEKWLEC